MSNDIDQSCVPMPRFEDLGMVKILIPDNVQSMPFPFLSLPAEAFRSLRLITDQISPNRLCVDNDVSAAQYHGHTAVLNLVLPQYVFLPEKPPR